MADATNLDGMTRDELNAYAETHGVADPGSYPNKAELVKAIEAAPSGERPTTGAQEAAADQEAAKPYAQDDAEPTGKDAPAFLVYQAGSPMPPPSGRPDMLWSDNEWDARDPEKNLFRVEDGKTIR